jgi:hypothetical protein
LAGGGRRRQAAVSSRSRQLQGLALLFRQRAGSPQAWALRHLNQGLGDPAAPREPGLCLSTRHTGRESGSSEEGLEADAGARGQFPDLPRASDGY